MSKEEKNIVNQLLGKKYKALFIMIWVTLALYIVPVLLHRLALYISPALSSGSDNIIIVLAIISSISCLVCLIITICYFTLTWHAKKAIKTLVRTNKLDYANEIISGDYNSNEKMGFARHVLYDKKTKIVVAYDDIVWVYKRVRDNTDVLFCTVDGKKHSSKIDDITMGEFLKRRSGILVGFTPQNQAVYDMKVKMFKAPML